LAYNEIGQVIPKQSTHRGEAGQAFSRNCRDKVLFPMIFSLKQVQSRVGAIGLLASIFAGGGCNHSFTRIVRRERASKKRVNWYE